MKLGPLYILAGGMASRLGALGIDTPKYLMDVGQDQVFADLHLQWVADNSFTDVVLCVGNHSKKIKDYCGDGSQWNLRISYSEDGPERLGTGGALLKAWLIRQDSIFAVTYGDTLLSLDCEMAFRMLHDSSSASGLMTVYKNTINGHVCNVDLDGEWAIYNKNVPNPNSLFIDYGFLVFKNSFMKQLTGKSFDLAEPLTKASLSKKLLAMCVEDRFWEIGSPEALEMFQKNVSMRFK